MLLKQPPSSWYVLVERRSLGGRSWPMNFRLLSSSTTSSTTTTTATRSLPSTTVVQSKFYTPRHQRTSPDSIYEIDNIYDSRIKRRRRIDPTRELNYTTSHWERHKSVYRRVKHMLTTFGSSPFQRLLFPDLFISSLVAGGLTYYNEFLAMDAASQIWMDGRGVAAGTTAIALLTGFRLNASYGRYNEGRKLMGAINTTSRDLATNSLMWVTCKEERDRMLKLIKAYSVAMTFHVNKKGGYHIRRCDPNFEEQIYAEYVAEMKDIFFLQNDDDGGQNDEDLGSSNKEKSLIQDEDFIRICDWFRNSENVPLGIATLMRGIIARNLDQKDALNRELDVHVQKLLGSLGGCERIQKTPIPTCFTRHTSRLLFVWSNMLPFAIYPVCGPFFTLPSTIAISYSIMGIEDIGVQLEEPFNILPLRQYSDGVFDGVDFIKSAYSANDGTG